MDTDSYLIKSRFYSSVEHFLKNWNKRVLEYTVPDDKRAENLPMKKDKKSRVSGERFSQLRMRQ